MHTNKTPPEGPAGMKKPRLTSMDRLAIEAGLDAGNESSISFNVLRNIMDAIEAQHEYIAARWLKHFREIRYYC